MARRGPGAPLVAEKFEVTGYDKDGRKVFHLEVEAPNDIVARLYATAALQKTADGAVDVHAAVRVDAIQKITAAS
jgi:hypothetical protein